MSMFPIIPPELQDRAYKHGVYPSDAINQGIEKLLDKLDALTNPDAVISVSVADPPPANKPPTIPGDDKARQDMPIGTGVIDYFPLALAEVARISKAGNDKHNPGEPLHWARGKSVDQANPIIRHWIQRGTIDPATGMRHSANMAWRALALLQTELELAQGYDAVAEARRQEGEAGAKWTHKTVFTEGNQQPKPAPQDFGGDNWQEEANPPDPFADDLEWLNEWNEPRE